MWLSRYLLESEKKKMEKNFSKHWNHNFVNFLFQVQDSSFLPTCGVILDVTNKEHIQNVLNQVTQKLESEDKKLFGVINNAGIQCVNPLEVLNVDILRNIFEGIIT